MDLQNLDGVQKKIIDQVDAFIKYGLSVDIISYYAGNTILIDKKNMSTKVLGKGRSKFDVIREAATICYNYEAFYIRYPKSDFRFLEFLKKIKSNSNKKIVIEIPTYPYDAQGKETLKGRVIGCIDKLCRKQLHKYVDRVVTFTGESQIFGIKTINTINGFDFSKVSPKNQDIDVQKNISLIAVSAMFVLHGYDRLINGLANYYRNGGKRNIVLHLVGQGASIITYKKIVEKNDIGSHVIFHGKLFGEELYSLYSGIAAGVNSLAIHRENLKVESTLKTKEYSAMGLPIISSSYVDALSKMGNEKFVFMAPADESYIDIDKMQAFIDRIYSEHSVAELHEMIRKDAFGVCDVSITTKPIIEYYVEK